MTEQEKHKFIERLKDVNEQYARGIAMMDVRKKNAKDLRKAWNKFLKEQKNGRNRKDKAEVKRVAENLEQRSVTYGI